ncbi:uncharacterized protein LOC114284036 isoform X3 [Camellia sinensis]|uniref:uncharacterized protein LOC114284036 isoform X3 n=1 Tax=Camellia sinensis TaxID=4442 RepID=UPI001035FF16|nr:uncharacterized protein LOC114284036 isoform X3 [Camellia sinensis]
MASVNSVTLHGVLSLSTPKTKPTVKGLSGSSLRSFRPSLTQIFSRTKQREWVVVGSVSKELDVIPVQSSDSTDQQDGVVNRTEREIEGEEIVNQVVVGGFGKEGRLSFEGAGEIQGFSSSASSSVGIEGKSKEEEFKHLIDRAINAAIVLAAGTFAINKLLTIDQDYWHGWTIYEILRFAPQHNWIAYEEALKTNPVLAKMVISGVVYSVGDWIAQCYEGKPLFEFDRARMFRSGLVGFTLHGSLSHYYYQFCEAGWKLWPFAHLITYGVIPVEQRLLWVDCVELIWVTILSTYSNEKSEQRISDIPAEANSDSPSISPPEE